MIYAIGGVSGSGKTLLRQRHQNLRGLPCIDIESFYRHAEQHGYNLSWRGALRQFLEAVDYAVGNSQEGSNFAVEAFFKPGGEQRAGLKEVAPRWNEPVTYIWCHAPRHECRRRVQANTTDSWQRKNARLDFVDSADEQYFWPVHGESEHEVFPPQPRLMMGTAQVMRGTFLPRC